MQASTYISRRPGYDLLMPAGRPAKSKRTIFGERLARVRQEAGLTQGQLAEKLGTTQRMMTYWEREPVALRSEQLAAVADALGVTADFLLGRETKNQKRGNGPVGRTKRVFERVSQLPRNQQQKILDVVDALVAQTGQRSAS